MLIKEGNGWKVCLNEENGRCFGEYGGGMSYDLYELSGDQFNMLKSGMTEGDATSIMRDGRHLYMSVNDRCGPPYTVVFDDKYETLCPWARIIRSGREWPDELTDAAVEIIYIREEQQAPAPQKTPHQGEGNDSGRKIREREIMQTGCGLDTRYPLILPFIPVCCSSTINTDRKQLDQKIRRS